MAKKTCPTLKPCKDKSSRIKLCKTKRRKPRPALYDRFSCLPNDILLAILSRLTIKDAAKTSLLSHKWNQLWRRYPRLHFEDPGASIFNTCKDEGLVAHQRSAFVSRVNTILDHHLGPVVDEFKVVSDLSNEYQSDIDKWLAFSLSNQVKRLELDFSCYFYKRRPILSEYQLELPSFIPLLPHNFTTLKPALSYLSLVSVNVTSEVVECFLTSFPLLEKLRIVSARYLTCVTAGVPVTLKCLVVFECLNLNFINLSAPKLLSFLYYGQPVKLDIRNASALTMVSVGGFGRHSHLAFAFDGLSKYFPQLTFLKLSFKIDVELNLGVGHLGFPDFPNLLNLKHLTLYVSVREGSSLLGWTPLIEESPMLQKLTVEFLCASYSSQSRGRTPRTEVINLGRRPLECLETLEIVNFVGRTADLEIAAYVSKNAPVLKEVIVNAYPPDDRANGMLKQRAFKGAEKLKEMLPQGVEFMFTWLGELPMRL